MKIKTTLLCRSSESILEEVVVEGLPHDHSLVPLISESSNGSTLPFHIYETSNLHEDIRTLLFVYPYTSLQNAACILGEQDRLGSIISTFPWKLSYAKAKWTSRLNYRTRAEDCARIKECPRGKWPTGGARIIFDRAAISPDHIVIRGAIRTGQPADRSIRVICLDKQLERIDSRFTILNNGSLNNRGTASNDPIDIEFSIRIPLDKAATLAEDVFVCALQGDSPSKLIALRVFTRDICLNMLNESNRDYLDIDCNAEYQQWWQYARISEKELERQSRHTFDDQPHFSIIVPLYKTPIRLFTEMVESVLRQSYSNWELILVNASPEDAALSMRAQEYAGSDRRVKVVSLDENLGISLNTSAGIQEASGDFICFFDHDDLLEPDILFEYTKAINNNPETDVLYCDEDKLTPDGFFVDPKFKPDFDIEYLADNNYICHLLTIRKTLLDTLPPNTPEYDGAQDHNMVLLASERARHVHHVRKILYHWRMSATSTSGNPEAKSYANIAGIKVVQAHYDRMGIPAIVRKSRRNFTYAVKYLYPNAKPSISVIIPTESHSGMLTQCLDSISTLSTAANIEVILVNMDNRTASSEMFPDDLYPYEIKGLSPQNDEIISSAEALNRGATVARGDFLLFMHDDVIFEPDFDIEHFVGAAARSGVGAVCCRLFYPDDCLQHAGYYIDDHGSICDFFKYMPRERWGLLCLLDSQRTVTAASSACMMIEKSKYFKAGPFNADLNEKYSDLDFCMRLNALGFHSIFTPELNAIHYGTCETEHRFDTHGINHQHCGAKQSPTATLEHCCDNIDPYFNETLRIVMGCAFHACLS